MGVDVDGMEAVRNVLRVSIEATKDLRPALEESAQEWTATVRRSFSGKTGPDGRRWPAAKNPKNPLGLRTGAMLRGEGVRVLPTGIQGLSGPYYAQMFKGGTVLGNRATGARKPKGSKKRRKRGTSKRGQGGIVQPARHVAPVEKVRGRASVLDEEWMKRALDRVAAHLAAEEA